jgi:hypothetical protein
MAEKEQGGLVPGRDGVGRVDGGDGMDPAAAMAWRRPGWQRALKRALEILAA